MSCCPHLSSLMGLILSILCALLPPWPPRSSSLPILFSAGSILGEIQMFNFFWVCPLREQSSSCRGDFGWCFSCIPCLLHSCWLQWDFPCERKHFHLFPFDGFSISLSITSKDFKLSVHHIAGKSSLGWDEFCNHLATRGKMHCPVSKKSSWWDNLCPTAAAWNLLLPHGTGPGTATLLKNAEEYWDSHP